MLSERLRPDLVALLVVVVLGITGALTPCGSVLRFRQGLAVVTIVSIFVLAEALPVTRPTQHAGDALLRVGGTRGRSVGLATVMVAGTALSLLMNNIAAAAVLLPTIPVSPTRFV